MTSEAEGKSDTLEGSEINSKAVLQFIFTELFHLFIYFEKLINIQHINHYLNNKNTFEYNTNSEYIYIYIERENEGERESEKEKNWRTR